MDRVETVFVSEVPFPPAAEGGALSGQGGQGRRKPDGIDVHYGRLRVRQLVFELPPATRAGEVELRLDDQPLDCTVESADGQIRIRLAKPLVVAAQQTLAATITTSPAPGHRE